MRPPSDDLLSLGEFRSYAWALMEVVLRKFILIVFLGVAVLHAVAIVFFPELIRDGRGLKGSGWGGDGVRDAFLGKVFFVAIDVSIVISIVRSIKKRK